MLSSSPLSHLLGSARAYFPRGPPALHLNKLPGNVPDLGCSTSPTYASVTPSDPGTRGTPPWAGESTTMRRCSPCSTSFLRVKIGRSPWPTATDVVRSRRSVWVRELARFVANCIDCQGIHRLVGLEVNLGERIVARN